ncbi:hypothetical protein [Vogesella sp. LIG4]|uniref:hypothetical protein n=1 Tax=Vogesella sp. LIG4 TaxID=1192162 RepID=UPI0012FDBB55|nr:hypothetical protein [Vogesella sp. LIG4]
MSPPLPDQTTQTIAVLATCFAQALGERNPEFIPIFEQKLQEMYSTMRDNSYFPAETLQAVRLVSDLLKA